MHINLIKTSFGLAAIAGVLSASGAARAASLGDCDAYDNAKPHLYVAGSSAIKPFIQALSTALKDTEVVVYVSGGSCAGVDFAINGTALPTGADAGVIGPDNCTVPAAKSADIGVSDVFATSCTGVTADMLDGFGDFQGPIQTMNFVVNKNADAAIQSISAEAAWLVFGKDPASNDPATTKSWANGTPWTAKDDIWIRGASSGTQSMLGVAIGLLPGNWALNSYVDGNNVKHALPNVAGGSGSGEMVTHVGGATNLDTTIGILASTELDDQRGTIRGLAFQGYGQSCGYWPDSESSAKDKLNVRTGKYEVWGPLHMYAAVDNKGKPSDDVADFVDYVNGIKPVSDADPLQLVKLEVTKNLVPSCAMQVSRDAEIGAPVSVNPTCNCFYESQRLHGGAAFAGCKACDMDADCDAGLSCSYGFCEAL